MCGICGFYQYKAQRPVEAQVLQGMLHVLRHRGPDGSGTYLDQHLALGMRRLSIIDLEGGNQPITNEDGSILTVFNGEIYNYRQLRELLIKRGHKLITSSDTEVLVHLYEDYGDDFVQHLRGMFAFAIWDQRQRRLLLARDRLGIKPLYFTQTDGQLIFGSEIKAILQHPSVHRDLDIEALTNFLSLRYVPTPQTMFKGIWSLPPGCTLSCDRHGVKTNHYWDLVFDGNRNGHRCEQDYAQELQALLRESVALHLICDVPFGAFLSGGVDSSTIVALMSQLLEKPVKTYSVGFEGDGESLSELPYARLVAQKFQTDHHEVLIRPTHLLELAETVAWHLDQPLAEHATLANFMVARLAACDVKMVLTGEGGDELFAGYARYSAERLAPWFGLLPETAKRAALAASARLPGFRREKIALYALSQPEELTRFLNWFPLFNSRGKQSVLSDDLKEKLRGYSTEDVIATQLARSEATDSVSRMLYMDTTLWLPDLLLARGDKMSMAASVEARVPLLDHKLVEFAASLPANLKVKGLVRKYLLKKVAQSWLPGEIVRRKKQGFPIPMALWLRNEARSFMHDILCSPSLGMRGLLNPRVIEQLIREHEQRKADHSALLWGLISLELWQRVFLDSHAWKPVASHLATQAV
jgi:asparagine synthase (glutamine-hydrolysing)